ncbi:MAG: site-specific integrase, partial [Myxococcales bacterium]|nr:site-specific integrase [Myxococcales bacterium]
GGDPARDRDLRRAMPTFGEVAERYMTEMAEPYRKASTVRGYRGLLRKHLLPALGSIKVADVERADVERLHQGIGKTAPGAANRALALVSVIMTNAERWGYRDARSNPCHRMPRFPERKMERFMTPEERARLEEVLAEGELAPKGHPRHLGRSTVAVVRLLLLTGARKGEITSLQSSTVHLERTCLRLPDSKTGAKVIPLSPAAVVVLRDLQATRDEGEAFVCPCQVGGGPLQNLGASWRRIRERAGLDGLRLHDARHSVASDMLADGMTLAEIAVVLGHKSTQTTTRYAHWADEGRQDIARRMGAAVERRSREGAERLQQQRQLAVGDHEGADVSTEGNVIRFPGSRGR